MASAAKEKKQQLRKQIKETLSKLSEDSIKLQCTFLSYSHHRILIVPAESVTRKVTRLPEYVNAKSISIFLSMPGREISTLDIVQDAFAKGKQIFIPYIYSPEGSRIKNMHMLRLRDEKDLKSLKADSWDIPSLSSENIETRENALGGKGISTDVAIGTSPKLDLIFMPGMAFDQSNNRLGHGKGFYDKYISLIHEIVSNSHSHSMPKLGK